MNDNEQALNKFSTRVRQLILQHQEAKQEIENLNQEVADLINTNEELNKQVQQLQKELANLKTARMLQVSDIDLESAQKKLNKLIRETNKCITLLSNEDQIG